jgi:hypothetical protein
VHFLLFFDFEFLSEGGADICLTHAPQNAVGVTADFSAALNCKSKCV